MNTIAWWIAADTILTAFAVILATAAILRGGNYMRQCRCVVQAQAKVIDRQADTAERMLPLLADRIDEPTAEFEPVFDEDEHPTGRHALLEPTRIMPAGGVLGELPMYYFAQGGEAR